jgi:glycylpeptide N-tetradecanoyltransferase
MKKQPSFWESQPVARGNLDTELDLPIDNKRSETSLEPVHLPRPFEYTEFDQTETGLDEVSKLLKENYLEDQQALFRYNYSKPLLSWALGHDKLGLVFGMRMRVNQKLVGFISGKPVTMSLNGHLVKCCEVNFLCLHKSLRDYGLAPKLISELTRRANLKGMWQAVFTTGSELGFASVSSAQYWHREINVRRLLASGFSQIPPSYSRFRDPVRLLCDRHRLPKRSKPNLRPLVRQDLDQVAKLLTRSMEDLAIHPVYSSQEVEHWLLPREEVSKSFVLEEDGVIKAVGSYFLLELEVLSNRKVKTLRVAQLFHNHGDDLRELIGELIVKARDDGCDVITTLESGSAVGQLSRDELLEMKFAPGDGALNYYLFNWKAKPVPSRQVGLGVI